MENQHIDQQDQIILKCLQEDARHLSSGDISNRTELSSSTVRKRIQNMEQEDVIQGYQAKIDYEKAGYPIRMILYATAPIPERGKLVQKILSVSGVVSVQELITGDENLLITVVGQKDSDITPVAEKLMKLGLTITDEVLVRTHETTPFEGFQKDSS